MDDLLCYEPIFRQAFISEFLIKWFLLSQKKIVYIKNMGGINDSLTPAYVPNWIF